jgi:molybdopterin synthase sulfur carrier subunit
MWPTCTRVRLVEPMAIVRLRGPLKARAEGGRDHSIDAATIGGLLHELERMYPALEGWILDERGVLRRHINVFVNAERGGTDTPVGETDVVDVLPAISGGSGA